MGQRLLFVLFAKILFCIYFSFSLIWLHTCPLKKGKGDGRYGREEKEESRFVFFLILCIISTGAQTEKGAPPSTQWISAFSSSWVSSLLPKQKDPCLVLGWGLVKRKCHGRISRMTIIIGRRSSVVRILRMGLLRSNMSFLVPVGTRTT